MRHPTLIAVATALAVALTPAIAAADLVAAFDRNRSPGNLDIGLANLSTGRTLALPSGVNTTADEFHPSLSADGRLLAFERRTPRPVAPETPFTEAFQRQILVVDLRTGRFVGPQSLASGSSTHGDPFLSGDARRIINGHLPLKADAPPTITVTELAGGSQRDLTPARARPASLQVQAGASGTFGAEISIAPESASQSSEVSIAPTGSGGCTAGTLASGTSLPAIGTGSTPLLAWTEQLWQRSSACDTTVRNALRIARFPIGFAGSPTLDRRVVLPEGAVGHPAIAGNGFVVLETIARTANGGLGKGSLIGVDTAGRISRSLPTGVDVRLDERSPAWTGDGRYLAWLRHTRVDGAEGDQVMLFDTETLSLVNPRGQLFIAETDGGAKGGMRRLRGNLSIAHDPTNPGPPKISCPPRYPACEREADGGLDIRVKGGSAVRLRITSAGLAASAQLLLFRESTRKTARFGRSVADLQPIAGLPIAGRIGGKGSRELKFGACVKGKVLTPGMYVAVVAFVNTKGAGNPAIRELSAPFCVDLTARSPAGCAPRPTLS